MQYFILPKLVLDEKPKTPYTSQSANFKNTIILSLIF